MYKSYFILIFFKGLFISYTISGKGANNIINKVPATSLSVPWT